MGIIFFYSKPLDLREIYNTLGGLLTIKLHTRSEHTSLWLQKINVTSRYPQYVEQMVAKYAQQMPKYTQQMATNTCQMVKTHFLCKTQFDWLSISFQEDGLSKI